MLMGMNPLKPAVLSDHIEGGRIVYKLTARSPAQACDLSGRNAASSATVSVWCGSTFMAALAPAHASQQIATLRLEVKSTYCNLPVRQRDGSKSHLHKAMDPVNRMFLTTKAHLPKFPRSLSFACTTYCVRNWAASLPSSHSLSISSGSVTPAADCRSHTKSGCMSWRCPIHWHCFDHQNLAEE